MATVFDEGNVRVDVATAEEIGQAIARDLQRVGLTYDELRRQAEDDEFTSEQARRLWFMISPIGH